MGDAIVEPVDTPDELSCVLILAALAGKVSAINIVVRHGWRRPQKWRLG
jgi:hypothetical protein